MGWMARLIVSIVALAATGPLNASAEDRLSAFGTLSETSATAVDHDAWDAFLSRYVKATADGRTVVDYGAVGAADKAALSAYIAALERVDPTALPRNEAFAYWANLYNALTVRFILDNYPVKSIRDIRSGLLPGPWKRDAATINGMTLTLDDIEHGVLRHHWSDNRVHYALNCASVGCPNLLQRAFRGDTLDDALNDAAKAYVNHPRCARFEKDSLVVASIYKWFIKDFGSDDSGVLAHLQRYADPALRARLSGVKKIGKFEYDWRLNDVGS